MSNQAPLTLFLRALVAAKKSLALYPPASGTAMGWIERLRHSLDDAFRQGLIFRFELALAASSGRAEGSRPRARGSRGCGSRWSPAGSASSASERRGRIG